MSRKTIIIAVHEPQRMSGDTWIVHPHSQAATGAMFHGYAIAPGVPRDQKFEAWLKETILPKIIHSAKRRSILREAACLLNEIATALSHESVRTVDEQRRSDQLFRLGAKASTMSGRCSLASMTDGGVLDEDTRARKSTVELERDVVGGGIMRDGITLLVPTSTPPDVLDALFKIAKPLEAAVQAPGPWTPRGLALCCENLIAPGMKPDRVLEAVRKIARGEAVLGRDVDGLDDGARAVLTKLEAVIGTVGQLADKLAELRGQKVAVEDLADEHIGRALKRLMEVDPAWMRAQS